MSGTAAVIVAGGSSRRMGFDKLWADLGGRPVIAHTVNAFTGCDEVDEIVLVVHSGRVEEYEAFVRNLGEPGRKVTALVEGGEERHRSVAAGLEAVDEGVETIAVHDAARPLVSAGTVARCVVAAREHGAVSLAHRVAETLKRAGDDLRVTASVERDGLWAMETPQAFDAALLRRAYSSVREGGVAVTDEVSAIQYLGEPVWFVEATEPNIKITVPRDIAVAAAVLEARMSAGQER